MRPPRIFAGLQAMRFLAAVMVVCTHATFYVSTRLSNGFPVWDSGTQGVPLFFVISGFVMTLSTASLPRGTLGARKFVASRLIRIVPLYWALNLLKLAQILALPALAFAKPDVWNVVLSMLFIPSRNAEGAVEAFYGVGWTLDFEMFFYAVLAIALMFRRIPLYMFMAAVLIPAVLVAPYRQEHWPAVTFLLNPLLLDFLWGVAIGHLYLRGVRVSPHVSLVCLVVGLTIVFALPKFPLLGLQYALAIGGAVFLEEKWGQRVPRIAVIGGDASYSLYLVHPMVGVLVAVILHRAGISTPLAAICAILVASTCAAYLTYVLFERPITGMLRRRFTGGQLTPAALPAQSLTMH
ncbi:acyltransferase family protein [Ramlibacter ginsenosidimutans]|nr:acyltransferase [Ramlibacter ginsenosidimutans]